jgi:uncharacterized membrane protein YphA (DoxX/SURF4 family)
LVIEFLLELGLLVGVFTPFFSLAGIVFLINTFLATLGQDWPWASLLLIGVLVVTFFPRAGRSLGVDAKLLKRSGESSFLFW